MNPATNAPYLTPSMCAPLLMTGGQSALIIRARKPDNTGWVPCSATTSKVTCAAGVTSYRLRAYPFTAWVNKLATWNTQLSMCEPLVLATGLRGAAGTAFLIYSESAAVSGCPTGCVMLQAGCFTPSLCLTCLPASLQTLQLSSSATATPASLYLVRTWSTAPPSTLLTYPDDAVRGPFVLRLGAASTGRWCKGSSKVCWEAPAS